jgi:anaerobic selenocysteine-containing dehydrogenase
VILPRAGRGGAVRPAKTKGAKATTSICSFCALGYGLIAHTKGGELVNLEGDPDHPINQGALCSKGQALREIVLSPRRLETVRYRAPGADHWEKKPLE